jgi:hypothetical protein
MVLKDHSFILRTGSANRLPGVVFEMKLFDDFGQGSAAIEREDPVAQPDEAGPESQVVRVAERLPAVLQPFFSF